MDSYTKYYWTPRLMDSKTLLDETDYITSAFTNSQFLYTCKCTRFDMTSFLSGHAAICLSRNT